MNIIKHAWEYLEHCVCSHVLLPSNLRSKANMLALRCCSRAIDKSDETGVGSVEGVGMAVDRVTEDTFVMTV
jgi:hypothetical protein